MSSTLTVSRPQTDVPDLTGTVSLVTGGGGGLGRVLTRTLASAGSRVVTTDILDLDDLVHDLHDDGLDVTGIRLDVRDADAIRSAVRRVADEVGDIDILVNNAIVPNDIAAPFHESPLDLWDRDYDVIVKGAVRTAKAVLPAMVRRRHGRIVNISSVNALAFYGHPSYSAAKAGLISLTRSIAVEYGRYGICSNAIAPGTLRTPAWTAQLEKNPETLEQLESWYPTGRVGDPEDIAAAVAFLASSSSGFTNGTVLTIDGGLTAGNEAMSRIVQGN